MKFIKQVFGVHPTDEGGSSYSPSKLALKLATPKKVYTPYPFSSTPTTKKILIVATETEFLEMANSKLFVTGNHPITLLVPMLHWEAAGFSIDIATTTGWPVAIEHWAMPTADAAVLDLYQAYKEKLTHPLDLREVVAQLSEDSAYEAVYIPGGHGVVADLPFSDAVKELIHWTAAHNKYFISSCHGSAAFLATGIASPYSGYQIAACSDVRDKLLPITGYLPGHMPYFFGKKLNHLGITVVNKHNRGTVITDRTLITGDGPKAANKLGIVVAKALLHKIATQPHSIAS